MKVNFREITTTNTFVLSLLPLPDPHTHPPTHPITSTTTKKAEVMASLIRFLQSVKGLSEVKKFLTPSQTLSRSLTLSHTVTHSPSLPHTLPQ